MQRKSIQATMKNAPAPLCGKDGGFTYTSIVKRLPDILTTVIENNCDTLSKEQLKRLKLLREEISSGTCIPSQTLSNGICNCESEEMNDWKRYEQQFQVKEKTWLEMPWFFLENWVYKLVLNIVNNGVSGDRDPFQKQKEKALRHALESGAVTDIAKTIKQFLEDRSLLQEKKKELLEYLISADLWGNEGDLSFNPRMSQSSNKLSHSLRLQYIVVNDLEIAIDKILENAYSSFNFIVDNCGLELVTDLFFGHCLVEAFGAKQVKFFVKTQPVFVSDATRRDFLYTIDQICQFNHETVKEFGQLFKKNLDESKWAIVEHKFFTSPFPFYEMPDDLYKQLKSSGSLTILKGDANYRRLFNDRNYDIKLEFAKLVDYFPTDLLVLRTLKSDCLVGMASPEQQKKAEELDTTDPNWRVIGKYAVISFAPSDRKSVV